jgi:hypothetical protein
VAKPLFDVECEICEKFYELFCIQLQKNGNTGPEKLNSSAPKLTPAKSKIETE